MVLITLEELKAEAAIREITLPDNDTYLEGKIDWATSHIQRESNRLFTDTEYTQSDEDYDRQSIYLHVTPVKSIETFTIDEVEVDEDTYTLNTSTGRVRLTTEPLGKYTYSITYIVCETDADIIAEARDICMDLVFVKLQAPDRQDVKQLKEGDVTFTYTENNPSTMTGINRRISGIKKNEIFLSMI
jgi:predicted RNase H-like nuclease (RuvC/YqgF family)